MNTPLKPSELRVAFTSNATAQLSPINSATGNATTAQLSTLEPASLLDLARNRQRNYRATSSPKHAQLATQNKGAIVARCELTELVRFCGEAYAFTDEDHAEALERALADYDSALTCFRAIKSQILAEAKEAR
ncbi:hypothetical protein C8R31_101123 [Nitrosospira sp. Nsp2]|uniref:hypothetical protein n=1 Tax=Nitrosospira sp. Nsp2 TaxID=136548 RepID=UPI000D3029BE|nr:hypothetical protein [Nitrosospira sp. Nsp2]PTR16970.1 hypothetical protein C8R31_101123 [Nitrosospira sp. Nsp2]